MTTDMHRDPLSALRAAVRGPHARLESHPRIRPIVDGDNMTRSQYADFLQLFHGYLSGLEQQVQRAWPGIAAIAARAGYTYIDRTPLLAQDLHDLGSGQPSTQPFRPAGALGDSWSPATLVGVLYVIEGARRGARILAPRVQHQWGFHAEFGAHYLHVNGDNDAAHWQSFTRVLNQVLAPHSLAMGTQSAIAVFDQLHAYAGDALAIPVNQESQLSTTILN